MTDPQAGDPATTRTCKRPGCGNPIPAGTGRGRSRVFCSDDCARRYHSDARTPAAGLAAAGADPDPLAAIEGLLRQASVLIKAACSDAEGLDPAHVRAEIADAEAARC